MVSITRLYQSVRLTFTGCQVWWLGQIIHISHTTAAVMCWRGTFKHRWTHTNKLWLQMCASNCELIACYMFNFGLWWCCVWVHMHRHLCSHFGCIWFTHGVCVTPGVFWTPPRERTRSAISFGLARTAGEPRTAPSTSWRTPLWGPLPYCQREPPSVVRSFMSLFFPHSIVGVQQKAVTIRFDLLVPFLYLTASSYI